MTRTNILQSVMREAYTRDQLGGTTVRLVEDPSGPLLCLYDDPDDLVTYRDPGLTTSVLHGDVGSLCEHIDRQVAIALQHHRQPWNRLRSALPDTSEAAYFA